MPTVAYEVIVAQSGDQSENQAVANAARYLTYGDHSDLFGLGDVVDVRVHGGGDGEDYGIGIEFASPIAGRDHRQQFEEEMRRLAAVETFEQVSFERV